MNRNLAPARRGAFLLRLALAAWLTTGLGGCMDRYATSQAVDGNNAVDLADNKLMLLNILRAANKRPMTFTAMSAYHSPSGGYFPSLGVGVPFGPGSASTFKRTTSGMFSPAFPSVDVGPSESADFINGITTSISVDTFGYYLDQGWPKGLLLHVFVHDIQLGLDDKNKTIVKLNNDSSGYDKFNTVIDQLSACDIHLAPDTGSTRGAQPEEKDSRRILLEQRQEPLDSTTPASPLKGMVGPFLSEGDLTDGVDKLVTALKDDKLDLVQLPHDQIAQARADHPDWSYVPGKEYFFLKTKAPRVLKAAVPKQESFAVGGSRQAWRIKQCQSVLDMYQGGISFSLRSPEAMLYYLGSVARRQLDGYQDLETGLPCTGSNAPAGCRGPIIRSIASELGARADAAAGAGPDGYCATAYDKQGQGGTFCADFEPLFEVRRVTPEPGDNRRNLLEVDFDGAVYAIPDSGSQTGQKNQAMFVLSLIKLIFNSEQSSKNIPSSVTTNVRIE